MLRITKEQALKLIMSTNGKIFKAVVQKKNGTFRRLVCRLHVRKGIKGIGLRYNPTKYNLITVYDMEKNGFRMLSIDRLQLLKVERVNYIIEGGIYDR